MTVADTRGVPAWFEEDDGRWARVRTEGDIEGWVSDEEVIVSLCLQ